MSESAEATMEADAAPSLLPRKELFLTKKPPAARDDAWRRLAKHQADRKRLAHFGIGTAPTRDGAAIAYDIARTKVMKAAQQNDWTSIGITSPRAGCGKTTLAANLALRLAHQSDCRVALVDMNLQRPKLAEIFGLPRAVSVEAFLKGRTSVDETFVLVEENLAVAGGRERSSFAGETLHSPKAGMAMLQLKQDLQPDIIVYDMPPMLGSDEVLAALPHVDAMLLVVEAEKTVVAEVDFCERELSLQTNVLGVVLNDCRYDIGAMQF